MGMEDRRYKVILRESMKKGNMMGARILKDLKQYEENEGAKDRWLGKYYEVV